MHTILIQTLISDKKNVDYLQPLSFSLEFLVYEKPPPIPLYMMLIYPCLEHIHLDMSSFSFWDRVLLYRCVLSWTYEFFLPLSLWHWYYSHVKQHLNFFLQLNTAHVVPREKVDLNYVSHHILNDQLLVILLLFTNFVVDKHTWTRKTQMYTPPTHTHQTLKYFCPFIHSCALSCRAHFW